MTFDEKRAVAEAKGWRVAEREFYNPGGTIYRLVLVAPDGNDHGFIDHYVQSQSLGKSVWHLVPDADAEAWNDLLP